MSQRRTFSRLCRALLVVALAVFLPASADGQHPPLASIARSEQQPSLTSVARTEQAVATEQWWLVSTVLRALQDLASSGQPTAGNVPVAMARDEPGTSSAEPWTTHYAAVVFGRRLKATVDLTTYVWDPQSYAAAAAELVGNPVPDVSLPSILSLLQDASPRALHEANVQVSASLATHWRSAAAHQQAALLLGAFALRESSAFFTDQRPVLCRITAHLAMARALGGSTAPATLDGRVGEIILRRWQAVRPTPSRLSSLRSRNLSRRNRTPGCGPCACASRETGGPPTPPARRCSSGSNTSARFATARRSPGR